MSSLKTAAKAGILTALSACAPGLKALRAGRTIVLGYHSIPSRERFRAQMEAILDRDYRIVSMAEFCSWLSGSPATDRTSVLLTFDDGYRDQLEHAVPVLGELRLPAVFFAVSGYLGRRSTWAHEFRNIPELPLMGPSDLRAIAEAGYEIGCHSRTHPRLTGIDPESAADEIVGSKRALEDVIGRSVTAFCYPYGDHDPAIASIVRDARFQTAFTVRRGLVAQSDDPFLLHRLVVLGQPDRREFDAYLVGTILRYWKLRDAVRVTG